MGFGKKEVTLTFRRYHRYKKTIDGPRKVKDGPLLTRGKYWPRT